MRRTTLTRAELHLLVWEKPLRTAAKELGVSDVGLSKICKRHGVPTPPQGHWTRVHMGKAVTKGELPQAKPGQTDKIEIIAGPSRLAVETPDHPAMPPEEQSRRRELLEHESRLEPTVASPAEPRKLHDMAARIQKALKGKEPDDYGCLRCADPNLPNVRVTPGGVPRAVAIVDAIARGADARRFQWKAGAGGKWDSVASLVVEGVAFSIEIYETVGRRPHELTKDELARKAKGTLYWMRTYDFFGTDRFSIRRSEWDQYLKDTKHQKVEDRLDGLFPMLIKRAFEAREERRQRAIEAERAARRAAWREEVRRLQGVEKKALEGLLVHVSNRRKADDLRALIAAVMAAPGAASDQRDSWVAWASAHAERIDPLCHELRQILETDFAALAALRRMEEEGEPD